jgi:hypothetical protein
VPGRSALPRVGSECERGGAADEDENEQLRPPDLAHPGQKAEQVVRKRRKEEREKETDSAVVGDEAVELRQRVWVDYLLDERPAVAPRSFERDEAAEENASHAVGCPREAAEQVAANSGERLSGHRRDDDLDRLNEDERDGCERSGGGKAGSMPRWVKKEGRVADDNCRYSGDEGD